jgi:hypothetical protein
MSTMLRQGQESLFQKRRLAPFPADDRANTAHLKHQPLDYPRAAFCVRRHELAGLFGKVDHERAELEYREIDLPQDLQTKRNASMTAVGDLRSSGGEAAGRHDWIDPAGPCV